MNAKICDRCGAVYAPKEQECGIVYLMRCANKYDEVAFSKRIERDLCESCYHALLEFVKGADTAESPV